MKETFQITSSKVERSVSAGALPCMVPPEDTMINAPVHNARPQTCANRHRKIESRASELSDIRGASRFLFPSAQKWRGGIYFSRATERILELFLAAKRVQLGRNATRPKGVSVAKSCLTFSPRSVIPDKCSGRKTITCFGSCFTLLVQVLLPVQLSPSTSKNTFCI